MPSEHVGTALTGPLEDGLRHVHELHLLVHANQRRGGVVSGHSERLHHESGGVVVSRRGVQVHTRGDVVTSRWVGQVDVAEASVEHRLGTTADCRQRGGTSATPRRSGPQPRDHSRLPAERRHVSHTPGSGPQPRDYSRLPAERRHVSHTPGVGASVSGPQPTAGREAARQPHPGGRGLSLGTTADCRQRGGTSATPRGSGPQPRDHSRLPAERRHVSHTPEVGASASGPQPTAGREGARQPHPGGRGFSLGTTADCRQRGGTSATPRGRGLSLGTTADCRQRGGTSATPRGSGPQPRDYSRLPAERGHVSHTPVVGASASGPQPTAGREGARQPHPGGRGLSLGTTADCRQRGGTSATPRGSGPQPRDYSRLPAERGHVSHTPGVGASASGPQPTAGREGARQPHPGGRGLSLGTTADCRQRGGGARQPHPGGWGLSLGTTAHCRQRGGTSATPRGSGPQPRDHSRLPAERGHVSHTPGVGASA